MVRSYIHLEVFDVFVGVEYSEEYNKQSLLNHLARSSCEALACLAGYRDGKPENDGVQNSLRAMLTPFVCRCLKEKDNDYVLKLLNSNTENPYLIWNNATRMELLEFVGMHRTPKLDTGGLFGAEFRMAAYSEELIVGDIFVRIYNSQANFIFSEPKKVCMDFLDFLYDHSQAISHATKDKSKKNGTREAMDKQESLISWDADDMFTLSLENIQKVSMVLEALANLLIHNTGLEILLIGHFKVIFSFLKAEFGSEVLLKALKIVSLAASNRECISDISSATQLVSILVLIVKLPDTIKVILPLLISLSSSGTFVKELLECGGLLYILNIFCESHSVHEDRLASAELLTKLQNDKLTGPRWTRFIGRYLPPIFIDALRDSPKTAISMFDSSNENPELIWNDSARNNVKRTISNSLNQLYASQSVDPSTKWNSNEIGSNCAYSDLMSGEVVVAGVFLRLFIANPSWSVRHPKEFTTQLMERVIELIRCPSFELESVTSAFVGLIRNHPTVADQLPSQGYLPQFCEAVSSASVKSCRSAILILNALTENAYCTDALTKLNCVAGIMQAMKNQPASVREGIHAVKNMAKRNTSGFASQFISTGMIHYLLKLLDSGMQGRSLRYSAVLFLYVKYRAVDLVDS
ncbi:hypothetical protein AB6A40_008903 [Gnathostoma spinigerum]|uniref:Uncharacterized protein n=1 Tax=Gnathostoma spinigerum TaxID=75299 RepID=A0ABD6EVH3_9BILA